MHKNSFYKTKNSSFSVTFLTRNALKKYKNRKPKEMFRLAIRLSGMVCWRRDFLEAENSFQGLPRGTEEIKSSQTPGIFTYDLWSRIAYSDKNSNAIIIIKNSYSNNVKEHSFSVRRALEFHELTVKYRLLA